MADTATPLPGDLGLPEKDRPSPLDLDGLIAGIQRGHGSPGPIKLTEAMLNPRGHTSVKSNVSHPNAVKPVKPIKYKKKKPDDTDLFKGPSINDLTTEDSNAFDEVNPTKHQYEFYLSRQEHAEYRRLVVYPTGTGRLLAFFTEKRPLDQSTLWMFYNVAEGKFKNVLDEDVHLYVVGGQGGEGYADYTMYFVSPGDTVEWKNSKHVVITSIRAPFFDDFEFLKKWMPL
ncbi:MAG: hypothetical protein GZ088_15990 [Acidipila sp.]|nr:hypothetical protein [Acidipila sp.]